jgi:hypothetical protein
MFKARLIKFVRSTAIGITALYISHNYTQPVIDKWRGRDGSSRMQEQNLPSTPTTPKPQEPKLVYNHGTWP